MQTPSNSNGSSRTLSLVEQVQVRRDELTRGLTADSNSKSTRADIESALAALTPMLAGDLTQLPEMSRRDLSRWLEANKYIGVQSALPPVAAKAAVADATRPAGASTAPAATPVPSTKA